MKMKLSSCKSVKRPLYHWEVREAQIVFGNQIDYQQVRIHECSKLPGWLQRVATIFNKTAVSPSPVAVCLGNHIYFPVELPESPPDKNHPDKNKIAWLIHELTHVWQFQHMGWKYLYEALKLQLRLGRKAYDYGGEVGLQKMNLSKGHIRDFNIEQQGDITRTYYIRKSKGENAQSWEVFIDEIKYPKDV